MWHYRVPRVLSENAKSGFKNYWRAYELKQMGLGTLLRVTNRLLALHVWIKK